MSIMEDFMILICAILIFGILYKAYKIRKSIMMREDIEEEVLEREMNGRKKK
ncbi:MAG: hypothetical protein NTX05_02965 [Fusobacteria bacterium]|nr:hypothetical protein [Fusobacteriota bacterium]